MVTKRIGVIGAGVMGLGVAQKLAEAGHHVLLIDNSEEAIARAQQKAALAFRFRKLLGASDGSVPAQAMLDRILFSTQFQHLESAGYVIENVTESWTVKSSVYKTLDAICAPECIFAANTSAIPITKLASLTGRPDKVIGVHFMNPVPMSGAVELIPGHYTSEETKNATKRLLDSIHMRVIEVNDSPGFVSNRVLMLMINEAIFLLHERVASAETVDAVFKQCMGHPIGPLETADLIGVDTILNSLEVLYENYSDPKFRPCPLLRHMVAAGLLGRKSGHGFYQYENAV